MMLYTSVRMAPTQRSPAVSLISCWESGLLLISCWLFWLKGHLCGVSECPAHFLLCPAKVLPRNVSNVQTASSHSSSFTLNRPRPVCARFLRNCCPLSAASCPYSHNKDDGSLCPAWTRGQCNYNFCPGRHYYLERDAAPVRQGPLHQVSVTANFSSPLVVKVKMLTEEHRREEVDLETGKRRSWIETQNKELIDITGEVSPVASPRKTSLKPTVPRKLTDGDGSDKKVAEEMSKKNMMIKGRNHAASGAKENKCGECLKEFKGDRGLKCHLRHPQSKCGKT